MTDFIAEISSNHNGDLGRCRRLIAEAAQVGCTGVKFQLFRIDRLFAPEILRVSADHRRRRRWELPLRFLPELSAAARDAGLKFGCTPFDLEAVDELAPHVDFLKVASYELPWLDLIHACAATSLPLIVSTGMADAGEAWAAVDAALESGCRDLTLLHCVSRYPVPEHACNLAAIGTLREMMAANFAPDWPEVAFKAGWSDHSVSPGVIGRALRHWAADVVEFHFDLEGRGAEFAGGHCWLPETIETVIAGGYAPVSPECDGTGRIAPLPEDLAERTWRADPSDGLRPTLPVRREWPRTQPESRRSGPDVFLVAAGQGLGHVARCLALAEALRDQHDADTFFFTPDLPGPQAMLDRHGFNHSTFVDEDALVRDISFLASLSRRGGPAVCVLDSEWPADVLARRLRADGHLIVVLDQPACRDADLGIVPSFGWEPPAGRDDLVGGMGYLLIREDVRACRALAATGDARRPRVVVCFGGSDPNELTARVAAALHDIATNVDVEVVLAPTLPHARIKSQVLARRYPEQVIIATGDPLESILAGAALLVTAMGVLVGEALALGTPVAILSNYEHDAPTVNHLAATEAVVDLGRHDRVDQHGLVRALAGVIEPANLAALHGAARGVIDGQGAVRAAAHVARLVSQRRAGPC
ncbi:MAG: N-acetylneuraminate synthase family protein [bacterium]|nr:N-acetylneuraminate synthase family protein [bacterium]